MKFDGTEEEREELTPQEIALRADEDARKKWLRNESGVDVFPEAQS